jgi:hypothetical protein
VARAGRRDGRATDHRGLKRLPLMDVKKRRPWMPLFLFAPAPPHGRRMTLFLI